MCQNCSDGHFQDRIPSHDCAWPPANGGLRACVVCDPNGIQRRSDRARSRGAAHTAAFGTEADPPCAWFIMDEAALHRVVGGPVTMRDHEGLAGAIVRGCQTAERHHPGHPLRGRRIFRHGKQLYYPGIYCSRGKCGVCRRTYWFHLS